MNNWFLRGLFAGIRTEQLPAGNIAPAALSQGMPQETIYATEAQAHHMAELCPTKALTPDKSVVNVITEKCVACMRCRSTNNTPNQHWRQSVHFAQLPFDGTDQSLPTSFSKSIHVRVIDAGDCGSCLNEIAQINGPSYNLHRFGIFITPTPRQADVLLVVGPVTRQMLNPLREAYEAMPTPKRVVALGACASSGGIFGPSLMCAGGVSDAIPVDLTVAGCPPPPLAIIHALRVVCGQEQLA